MNFSQFISIIWFRKWFALLIVILTVATALAVSLSLPKQYIAKTSILAEQRSVDLISGQNIPSQLTPGYLATQVGVIGSHNVSRKVVDTLNLVENPLILEDIVKIESSADLKDQIADLLLEKLDISPSHESSLIEIEFTSTDPKFAALIANAFASAYMQTNVELRTQPAKLGADWFDLQMTSLREHLEHAQSMLSTYQQQHEIIAVDDRLDLENSRLAELSKQLVDSQAQTSGLQSRKDLLVSTVNGGASSEAMQEVLNNAFIQSLKSELAKAEASFADLSKRVDYNHPKYKQAKAEVTNLQQKIQSEIKMVVSNIASGVDSSNQRDRILTNSLAKQKAKVLELKKQYDDMAVLKREVENAQHAYDAAMQRSVQSHMESEMNQTNIAILNPALPPIKHAKPRVLLNVVLALFLGSMLAVGAALFAESMDRRVRSAFDVTDALALPVFAVVSFSDNQSRSKRRSKY